MRILCVIDSLCSGGAQRQLVELGKGFKQEGHHVSFLTYHNIPFFKPALDQDGINSYCIQSKSYLSRIYKMRRYIRNGKYDAVLSFLEAPNFICELAGLPFRKWILIVGERSAKPNILSVPKIFYRWMHLLSDYIVANSYANLELVISANPLISKSKRKVIYNIVDIDLWKPSDKYTMAKDGIVNIIIAASVRYPKNLIGLIDGVTLLNPEQRKKIIIHWYGNNTDSDFKDYFNHAYTKIIERRLENVFRFYPATHAISEIMQKADAIGLFSLHEGLPNAICEGMACAKPIVCTAVSDLSTILGGNPELLADPNDPESIKNVLIALISKDAEELREIGRRNLEIARQSFNKKMIINQYLDLLT